MNLLSLFVFGLLACGSPEPEPPAVTPTVVIISLDTTRADALSCYAEQDHWRTDFPPEQRPQASTPAMDALAQGGVRFAWALAHAPTTLNSHTSIFSGMDPHRHRVVRNGYPVPDDVPLLTERFADAGWDTLAVVGSSALEEGMGLSRGFRVYDDLGPQPPGAMMIRDGKEVTARALEAVDARTSEQQAQPLLIMAHYYDAHTPWFTAPPEVVSRFVEADYEGPADGTMMGIGKMSEQWRQGRLRYGDARQARGLYLAQVAWVDQQVDLLLEGLRSRGLLDEALVVVVADHGESLDDALGVPYSHGPDVDLVDIHVPLILWGSGSLALPEGAVVEQPVRLQDIASTVVSHVGIGEAMGDGFDLAPLWKGGTVPDSLHFAEATKPLERESKKKWNNLPFERAIVQGRTMLVGSPLEGGRASLFAVAPGQPRLEDQAIGQQLAQQLAAWDQAAPAFREAKMSSDTVSALQALGYLEPSAQGDAPAPDGDDDGDAASRHEPGPAPQLRGGPP